MLFHVAVKAGDGDRVDVEAKMPEVLGIEDT